MIEDINDLPGLVLFAIGRTPVTLGSVVAGLSVIVIGLLLARAAKAGIHQLRGRSHVSAPALYIVEKLATYGIAIIAVVVGFSTVGINLSSLAVFAGALGVGLGLGLQGVVKEFVSGLVLVFDRVMTVGDYVELEDGRRGLVHEIGARAVRVRTNDDIDLFIPNSKFIEGPVINWTLRGRTSRIHISFSVAYASDRQRVREVVLEAARSVPFTSPENDAQKTQVWLVGFGDSALQFELVVWPTLDAVKRPGSMKAAYTWAIADALECAGIEVPFPQMDVRLRSLFGREGGEALGALRLEAGEASERPSSPPPDRAGHNDAAEDLKRPLPPLEPDPPDA